MVIRVDLQNILTNKGISQHQLARLTGIKQPTINSMCQNTIVRFPLDSLDKICNELNCELTDILIYEKELPK